MSDIYKVGGVVIHDRKLLVVRTKGRETFYAPGGKPEPDESPKAALERELEEEVGIRIRAEHLEPFGTFEAEAADMPGKTLTMDVFIVHSFKGAITPSNEIEEVKWIDSAEAAETQLGSIYKTKVVPKLVAHHLID